MAQAAKEQTRQDAEEFKSLEDPPSQPEQPPSPKASVRELNKLREDTRRGKEGLVDAFERVDATVKQLQQELQEARQQLSEANARGQHLAVDYGTFKTKTNSTLAAKAVHLTTLSDSLHQLQEQGPNMEALRGLLQQQAAEVIGAPKAELTAMHTSLAVIGVPSQASDGEPDEEDEDEAMPGVQRKVLQGLIQLLHSPPPPELAAS
ncbi:hypothetical protein DUNSADRAFT_14989 [Dunaliella salina]|uniref:Uncharacterized protein n=1 Tax=Dunaliella salina TaxID=3046 RepID=A0ABQ7H299_DUNSA|nr:hypothetical protein DUNSADRAFT_14989 [Dunaliella salina]KAF5840965.1 hypothetical protein DUNSADRAFT_14989 [Dunaliella salina]|eukprot:KAF5840964.1 hypothetical protein DUNSADRAFT_14989 [Dunaliella salina]